MSKLSGAVIFGMLLAFCTGAGIAADDDKNKNAGDTAVTKPLKHDKREARKDLRQRQHARHINRANRAAINERRAINNRRANSAGN